jgi:LmbE family N-acetylglucosaminyl deacetylase
MNYERVLVFGAHADDELRMAGTMALLADRGVHVAVVTMTNGSEGYPKPEWRDQIVAMRRQEAADADRVLGIARRYSVGCDDMGLVNDKVTLQECIRIVREVRPQAVFTHGPDDRHRDHLATHALSMEAVWHAGEPVAAQLGASWRTPHLYYYKACNQPVPTIVIDTTAWQPKVLEAYATQVSQHTLFRRTREDFLAEAERLRKNPVPASERFWIVDRNVLSDFLPI